MLTFITCLQCDLIFASKGCKFGLPEVKIGLIPGAGGTQRLTNAVGKYQVGLVATAQQNWGCMFRGSGLTERNQAMKMILFGAIIDVDEASSHGLIAGTFQPGGVLDGAVKVAQQVAGLSSTAVQLAKEAVCRSEWPLNLSLVVFLSRSLPPFFFPCHFRPFSKAGCSSAAYADVGQPLGDSLGRDDDFERSLYYFSFGTAHKREGISAFLQKRQPDWEGADRGAS